MYKQIILTEDKRGPLRRDCCRLQPDILALKHSSRIFGHFGQFLGVVSPPVQCSSTGLKMRNKKCWPVAMSENSTNMLYSEISGYNDGQRQDMIQVNSLDTNE